MRIAIDVHSLGSQSGGNETYFRHLISGLTADPASHAYTLLYTHSAALESTGHDPRFSFVPVPANPIRRISFALPRLLNKLKPDVFHCQYVQPPLTGKVRTVVSIHDLAHEHYPEYFHPLEALRLKKLVRWSARRADHILTLSEFSATDIVTRYGVPREKITVTYLAASPAFQPRDKQESRQFIARKYRIDGPFVLYVGRIQARKNLPRLAEAYARLLKQGLTAKLVLVGKKDWQFKRLASKIKDLGIESSVIFPGFVAFEDLPIFYNAAEVFAFPSFFEGFGLPVIESMASGLPTITSIGSSLGEVAGDAALLVDPLDTDALGAALEKAISDQALRKQLIVRGLQRSAQFTHENLAHKALEVYRSLGP